MSLLSPGTELKRFRHGTMPKVAVVVLLFIPLIYGALYLWAFWAPDQHMDALPIALVNEDSSVTLSDGTTLDAGAQVVDELLARRDLGWEVVGAADAAAGVSDGRFTFAVTIPADFSLSLASVESDEPASGRIEVQYNDTNSFLATTLGQHAMIQVRDAVAATTTQATATTMLVGISTLADGVRDASEAARQIDDGATTLGSGLVDLSAGVSQLSTGAADAAKGGKDLVSGLDTLHAGAADLSAGLGQLSERTSTLGSDSAALAAGASQVSSGLSTIAQLEAAYPTMTLAQLEATLESKGGSLAALSTGAASVSAGASTLATSAPALTTAISQLSSGANQLTSGTATADAGARDLSDGLAALAAGAASADSGAATAASGANELATGTTTFATTLEESAALAPRYTSAQIQTLSAVIATPVVLDENTANEVQGFGEGFAPFFIALATFVGALITWLILRPLPRRPLASNASGIRTVMTGYIPAVFIAAGQVVIMMAVLVWGLGLRPKHLVATTLFIALTTLAFVALQQMFIILLGTAAGRVVSLVLLMLQLSSSGGTYPVETTPHFFSAIHPFMPATYVVDGLRALMGGGVDSRLWIALAFMTGLLVISLVVSAIATGRQRVWTIARLHPELTV
ncbi:MAG: YhgE/Pip domain-containing protein [Demequinaceae bacterium]|nr:YhgE/Pip domain-containing protein [Demequinaceae bacterium]